jgi:hypothetical protein
MIPPGDLERDEVVIAPSTSLCASCSASLPPDQLAALKASADDTGKQVRAATHRSTRQTAAIRTPPPGGARSSSRQTTTMKRAGGRRQTPARGVPRAQPQQGGGVSGTTAAIILAAVLGVVLIIALLAAGGGGSGDAGSRRPDWMRSGTAHGGRSRRTVNPNPTPGPAPVRQVGRAPRPTPDTVNADRATGPARPDRTGTGDDGDAPPAPPAPPGPSAGSLAEVRELKALLPGTYRQIKADVEALKEAKPAVAGEADALMAEDDGEGDLPVAQVIVNDLQVGGVAQSAGADFHQRLVILDVRHRQVHDFHFAFFRRCDCFHGFTRMQGYRERTSSFSSIPRPGSPGTSR